jgi:hypothetical protein
MTAVTRTRVLEETPERVVMRIDYHYRDETMDVETDGGTKYGCDGFGERDFTFARSTAGGLDVLAMTGRNAAADDRPPRRRSPRQGIVPVPRRARRRAAISPAPLPSRLASRPAPTDWSAVPAVDAGSAAHTTYDTSTAATVPSDDAQHDAAPWTNRLALLEATKPATTAATIRAVRTRKTHGGMLGAEVESR